ncbi:MAG: ABC transporter substrate-binding protein [Coriobacteriia bacterium]
MKRTTRISRALALLLAAAVLVAGLAGCGGSSAEEGTGETPSAAFPVTVTDDADRQVTVSAEPQRIVSLAPANTEIIYGLGLLDRLVGVTTFDDYPAEVADIEKVGDFITPNLEAIAALEPDLVLATTGVQADIIERIEATGATVVAVDPQTLDELLDSIEMVGAVTGTSEAAAAVIESMQIQIEDIAEQVEGAPVRCFIEIAQDPLFTAGQGTLLNDLIEHAGGENVVTQEGYVGYSLEQLLSDDPAVYLATLGSMSDPADLAGRPGYAALTAVKEGRVYVLEDNLVSRPGPRVVEGIRQIAAALHPGVFEE